MVYSPKIARLTALLNKLRLEVDYDPDLTELTVYPRDEDSTWGVLVFDGVSASPYERELNLIQAIEDHPRYESLIEKDHAELEKLGVALTKMDGTKWYAASTQHVKKLTAARFGKNGKIWLTPFPELAMIRVLKEGGRRRVGFNRTGEVIRGTLQLEFPGKVNWSKQFYLYEVKVKDLDLAKVFRVGNFQFDVMAMELKPSKVHRENLMSVKRRFKVEDLYKEDKDA